MNDDILIQAGALPRPELLRPEHPNCIPAGPHSIEVPGTINLLNAEVPEAQYPANSNRPPCR